MEKLKTRLDALQDEILSLYEEDSTQLQDQIRHWQLQRKDYVLQYCARSQSYTRIGFHPMLPQSIAQEKAKGAIEMVLHLTSLSKSAFAQEPWTLTDTSREMWNAPPSNAFKKAGHTVEVCFDGDKENRMQYTTWDAIYYECENDTWDKQPGLVDLYGCYYMRAGVKTYFVDFKTEAAKYSKNNEWEVYYKGLTYSSFASVSSTTSSSSTVCECPSDCERDSSVQQWGHSEDLQQHNRSNDLVSYAPDQGGDSATGQRQQGQGQRPKSRGQGQRSRRPWVRLRSRRHSACDPLRSRPNPRRRPQAEEGEDWRRGQEDRPGEAEEPRPGGRVPRPEEEGRQVNHPDHRRARRPQAPVEHAAHEIPIAFLRGPANSLKCARYRWRLNYSQYFTRMSKVWSWVDAEGAQGGGRITVAFQSCVQRGQFLSTVPIPPNISVSVGRISAL